MQLGIDVFKSKFDDFSSDSIGTGEETDFEFNFEFEFDGRKETRSPRTIFQQFIGQFKDERELSANDTVLRKFISTVDLEGKTYCPTSSSTSSSREEIEYERDQEQAGVWVQGGDQILIHKESKFQAMYVCIV